MKYAIIENEEYSRTYLHTMIRRLRPQWTHVFNAESVEESIENLSLYPDIDLLFMDIELDDGTCFEIFDSHEILIPIIFTTAYSEYAIRAFKVNSIDYVLKPVEEEEVRLAIEKFESRFRHLDRKTPNYEDLKNLFFPNPKYKKRILISVGDKYKHIETESIAWFEAEEKYISIVRRDGTVALTDLRSLSDLMNVLDPEKFFQISRSIIASIESIASVNKLFKGRLRVSLKAGQESRAETVSAARRPQFLDWLGHS